MHRILIVEDNPVDQRLFEQALGDPTREIEICSDGREALAAFERRAADVVISDIMMPNMEGNELLTELHRRVPGLPIILVTRFGSISAAVAAMQAGAFDYVTKPVEVFELQTRVKRALELDQLHHENDTLRQELAGRFGPDSVVAESITGTRSPVSCGLPGCACRARLFCYLSVINASPVGIFERPPMQNLVQPGASIVQNDMYPAPVTSL